MEIIEAQQRDPADHDRIRSYRETNVMTAEPAD